MSRQCSVISCSNHAIGRGLCRKHYGRFYRYGSTRERVAPTTAERFWAKVNKNGPIHPVCGQCWIWAGGKFRHGYGAFTFNRKLQKAHRYSWEIHNSPPGEKLVLHHCDNPSCVNPAHLFLGTDTENMEDRDQKGRQTKGEEQHKAKLTEKQVLLIRRVYKYGSSKVGCTALARVMGVSYQTILRVIKNVTWKHLLP